MGGDECIDAIKGACGAANYVGDKYCDDNNNNAGCNWDKGDCCGPKNNYKFCKACKCRDCTFVSKGDECVKSIKKGCGSPNWKGDGNCDDNNNVGGCNWDGGDCCGDKANKKYCAKCFCLDCTKVKPKNCPGKLTCKFPNYKKDKNCDDENNNCQCDWDGGDCCSKSNGGSVNTKYCKQCKCLDPKNKGDSNCKGTCKFPNYKGDGNCDDENNNCGCAYDGGDCCKKTVKGGAVKKSYCKVCACIDQNGQ